MHAKPRQAVGATWPNAARAESSLMLAPRLERGVTLWQGCPLHHGVYQSARVNVLVAHITSDEQTAVHAHAHDMVATLVSELRAADETVFDTGGKSPETNIVQDKPPGSFIVNLPPAPGVPFVHRIGVRDGVAAFVAAESPLPPLPRDSRVPRIRVDGPKGAFTVDTDDNALEDTSTSHFYAAASLRIAPGAHALISVDTEKRDEHDHAVRSTQVHVARLICSRRSDIKQPIISNDPNGKLQQVHREFSRATVSVQFVTDFENFTHTLQTCIHNIAGFEWHGVVIDIYGAAK